MAQTRAAGVDGEGRGLRGFRPAKEPGTKAKPRGTESRNNTSASNDEDRASPRQSVKRNCHEKPFAGTPRSGSFHPPAFRSRPPRPAAFPDSAEIISICRRHRREAHLSRLLVVSEKPNIVAGNFRAAKEVCNRIIMYVRLLISFYRCGEDWGPSKPR